MPLPYQLYLLLHLAVEPLKTIVISKIYSMFSQISMVCHSFDMKNSLCTSSKTLKLIHLWSFPDLPINIGTPFPVSIVPYTYFHCSRHCILIIISVNSTCLPHTPRSFPRQGSRLFNYPVPNTVHGTPIFMRNKDFCAISVPCLI